MRQVVKFLLVAFGAVLIAATHSASANVSIGDMTRLQAMIQQYVDRKSVNGAYLFFDIEKTAVRELYPASAHPMILQMGEHFVMCFDFVDSAGDKVEVDYYVARKGDEFFVFYEAIGARNIVEAMMKGGRVTPVQ